MVLIRVLGTVVTTPFDSVVGTSVVSVVTMIRLVGMKLYPCDDAAAANEDHWDSSSALFVADATVVKMTGLISAQ